MKPTHLHIRLFTGPIAVDQIASRFESAGIEVTCRGTEHIHLVLTIDDPDRYYGQSYYINPGCQINPDLLATLHMIVRDACEMVGISSYLTIGSDCFQTWNLLAAYRITGDLREVCR